MSSDSKTEGCQTQKLPLSRSHSQYPSSSSSSSSSSINTSPPSSFVEPTFITKNHTLKDQDQEQPAPTNPSRLTPISPAARSFTSFSSSSSSSSYSTLANSPELLEKDALSSNIEYCFQSHKSNTLSNPEKQTLSIRNQNRPAITNNPNNTVTMKSVLHSDQSSSISTPNSEFSDISVKNSSNSSYSDLAESVDNKSVQTPLFSTSASSPTMAHLLGDVASSKEADKVNRPCLASTVPKNISPLSVAALAMATSRLSNANSPVDKINNLSKKLFQAHASLEPLAAKPSMPATAESQVSGRRGSKDMFDPLCFIHQKFDGIVEMTDDLSALAIATEDGASISHQRLVKTASGVRELAKRLGKVNIDLHAKSIMIVTKARDNSLVYLTRDLAYWLIHDAKKTVYVDAKLEKSKRFGATSLIEKLGPGIPKSSLRYWTKKQAIETPEIFDLAITLGGDGTVLYLSKLFQRIVPPTIAFSLGSLGFLTNFRIEDARKVLSTVFAKGINVNLRMRFSCTVHSPDGKALASHEVLNEIVIDRGPSPWVSMLELYGNDSLLTVVQADGLILSTPTGSTAYSLSAGGSLVHPEVSAVSVTPICPHTLSFRPMLLPDSMVLRVTVPKKSRSTAWASFDGHDRTELKPGHYVTVSASQFPFPTVVSSPNEYIDSVSRTLKWNVRQQQKPFEHLLSKESRRRYQNLDLRSAMSERERVEEEEREDAIEEEEYERTKERKGEKRAKKHPKSPEGFANPSLSYYPSTVYEDIPNRGGQHRQVENVRATAFSAGSGLGSTSSSSEIEYSESEEFYHNKATNGFSGRHDESDDDEYEYSSNGTSSPYVPDATEEEDDDDDDDEVLDFDIDYDSV